VFAGKEPIVLMMDKPWYQKMFDRTEKPDVQSTRAQADDGDADAQFRLALQYASSEGTAQDNVQAALWYLKAADQRHSLAQFNLGMMYAQGQGMPRDEAKAVWWFEKAAQQGDAGAQFNLGMRQHRASGTGLPADVLESKIEAYKWFHLAAAQGYKGSDAACERVTLSMSHEELAAGNRRAAAFVATESNHQAK
jgi:TPR repeat protein